MTQRNWTLREMRKAVLIVGVISSFALLIRVAFFAPTAPSRDFLLTSDNEENIINSLKWYTLHSNGSLKAQNNRCILKANYQSLICSNNINTPISQANIAQIKDIIKAPEHYPYIWKTKDFDKEALFEFAMFKLEPTKILSKKDRSTVLGQELLIEAEFKKTGMNEIAKILLPTTEIKRLEKEVGQGIAISVAYLPNPYGHYLPIYPLPNLP